MRYLSNTERRGFLCLARNCERASGLYSMERCVESSCGASFFSTTCADVVTGYHCLFACQGQQQACVGTPVPEQGICRPLCFEYSPDSSCPAGEECPRHRCVRRAGTSMVYVGVVPTNGLRRGKEAATPKNPVQTRDGAGDGRAIDEPSSHLYISRNCTAAQRMHA